MKNSLLILLIIACSSIRAQESSGGGTFSNYKMYGVVKVEEFNYSIENPDEKDSIPVKTCFYNEFGQLIKEQFNQYLTTPFYTFEYNKEGFLINIDTNGMFVYGSSSSLPLTDTCFTNFTTEEIWFSIDTISRLKTIIKHFQNDSLTIKTEFQYDSAGRLINETVLQKMGNSTFSVSEIINYEFNELNLLVKKTKRVENPLIGEQITRVEAFRYYLRE